MTAEAKAAYDARAWSRVFTLLSEADELDADDLDRYAVAAFMLGRLRDYYAIRERAYDQQLAASDLLGAARAALWIVGQKFADGEVGAGTGWLSRAERLVEAEGSESVEAGFLRMCQAFGAAASGDIEQAVELSAQAADAGRRYQEANLVGLALHQEGLFLLDAGRHDEGLARLDEAMLELASGGLSPMVEGIVYCGTISGCWTASELNRAQQWTAAMTEWCRTQPDLTNFTAECKVHRAELKQFHGAWAEAMAEAAGVSGADVDRWAAGAAACLRGNLNRLQGRFDDAEESFAVAARLGIDPQPGLALLRLAQGSVQAAAAMLRRCLAETQEDAKRVEQLFAAVEVLLAAGEPEAAGQAADELAAIAHRRHGPLMQALNAQAEAMVRLAERRPDEALAPARTALRRWVQMQAPYQEARTRLLISEACHVLRDTESAASERDTACEILERLAAAPDLARLRNTDGVLSPRELEVLRILATGATNRVIAERLVLSERTVDRHVSNIFRKLGVSTRAAATAYALERQVV